MNPKLNKILLVLLIVVVIVVVLVVALWFVVDKVKTGTTKESVYSLVLVQAGSNTASYFGQITGDDHGIITLKDPGYIDVQPAKDSKSQPQISFYLMKDEFIKPLTEMKIYKQNIIFVQELASDSPILNAYKQQAQPTATPLPPVPAK